MRVWNIGLPFRMDFQNKDAVVALFESRVAGTTIGLAGVDISNYLLDWREKRQRFRDLPLSSSRGFQLDTTE